MKLKVLVFITTTFTLSAMALAQSVPTQVVAPVVPTGKTRQVAFFPFINPDCSVAGDIDARVVKQPEHGDIDLEQGPGFPNFKPDNVRSACNTRSVPGTRVKYTSKDGYLGKDAFEIEFLAGGADVIWKFAVTVK
jgi:hypothetical protein